VQHASRNTGEAAAALPVHKPISRDSYTPQERVVLIKKFQFLDEKECVKVYLPLDNLDRISQDDISAVFESESVCVTIRGAEDAALQFKIAKLHHKIDPEECTAKILKSKILLKLKKARSESNDEYPIWYQLRA
jgi:hypothetical protein